MDCGLLVAVSTKVNVAVRVPVAVGLKNTVTAQPCLEVRVLLLQPLELMLKSPGLAPDRVTLETEMEEVSLFVRIIDFAWLVDPTATLP